MPVEDAYELAYREAVRALDHQRTTLTELRSRAGMLLATASISLSLLGRDAFREMRPCAWAAIVCFALLGVCVLAIVWPYDDWTVDIDAQSLLAARLVDGTPALVDLSLELIAYMAQHRQANSRRLVHVARVFRTGSCLLAIQMVLTIVMAGGIV